jgi:hypothetical protein
MIQNVLDMMFSRKPIAEKLQKLIDEKFFCSSLPSGESRDKNNQRSKFDFK